MSRINWHRPADDLSFSKLYPIIRPKPNVEMACVIWSDEPLGTYVHYLDGRTVPCQMTHQCVGCLRNLDRRYESYLWIRDSKDDAIKILALPHLASLWLFRFCEAGRTLFGRTATFSRTGRTKRSQVRCLVCKTVEEYVDIPNLPELKSMMARIWGTALSELEDDSDSFGCGG